MSGGSHNYECYRFEDEYHGQMMDPVMDQLIHDLVPVLHDLEWWQSSDISEADYRETVAEFKRKWIGKPAPILRDVVEQEIQNMRKRLLTAVAWTDGGGDGR